MTTPGVDAPVIAEMLDLIVEQGAPLVHRDVVARLGDHGAVAFYDALAERHSGIDAPEHQLVVARAAYSKGIALDALGRRAEAIGAYDEVIDQFGNATDPSLRVEVARSLFMKAWTLAALHRDEEALIGFDAVIERFGAAADAAAREEAALALVYKVRILRRLRRRRQALTVAHELVTRYKDDPDIEIRAVLGHANRFRRITAALRRLPPRHHP